MPIRNKECFAIVVLVVHMVQFPRRVFGAPSVPSHRTLAASELVVHRRTLTHLYINSRVHCPNSMGFLRRANASIEIAFNWILSNDVSAKIAMAFGVWRLAFAKGIPGACMICDRCRRRQRIGICSEPRELKCKRQLE